MNLPQSRHSALQGFSVTSSVAESMNRDSWDHVPTYTCWPHWQCRIVLSWQRMAAIRSQNVERDSWRSPPGSAMPAMVVNIYHSAQCFARRLSANALFVQPIRFDEGPDRSSYVLPSKYVTQCFPFASYQPWASLVKNNPFWFSEALRPVIHEYLRDYFRVQVLKDLTRNESS